MANPIIHLEEETKKNINFRTVLYTANYCQLVVMSLKPGEEIGEEIHTVDQFFRIEEGEGKIVLNDVEYTVEEDDACIVRSGIKHNVINTSQKDSLKLYTVYAPPQHPDGTIHITKEDAEKSEKNNKE